MLLRLKGVSKSYDGVRWVLRGVDLGVPEGGAVLVRGPSGSGKTTLLMVSSGIETPDSGEVWVAGRRIDNLDPDSRADVRREHISMIFEGFVLLEDMSVLDNVLLPLRLKGEEDRERAMRILERLDMADKAGKGINELSMGERQRVAIARALVDPRSILLADDPTSNLDPRRVGMVADLFKELLGEGKGILVVSQDPRLEELLGPERVYDLVGGRLVEASP